LPIGEGSSFFRPNPAANLHQNQIAVVRCSITSLAPLSTSSHPSSCLVTPGIKVLLSVIAAGHKFDLAIDSHPVATIFSVHQLKQNSGEPLRPVLSSSACALHCRSTGARPCRRPALLVCCQSLAPTSESHQPGAECSAPSPSSIAGGVAGHGDGVADEGRESGGEPQRR
jgi:hypothetical protein